MNPEEVPSRPSWEIGKQLVDQLLAQQRKAKGRYPEKVAFTLNSFATFQDYGVMEAQILYLLGVRPQWDDRNLVGDVRVDPGRRVGTAPHRRVSLDGRLLPRYAAHPHALARQGDSAGRRARRARQLGASQQPARPAGTPAARARSAASRELVAGADLRRSAGAKRRRRLLLPGRAFRAVGHPQGLDGRLPGLLPLRLHGGYMGRGCPRGLQSSDPGKRSTLAKLVGPHPQPAVEQV